MSAQQLSDTTVHPISECYTAVDQLTHVLASSQTIQHPRHGITHLSRKTRRHSGLTSETIRQVLV